MTSTLTDDDPLSERGRRPHDSRPPTPLTIAAPAEPDLIRHGLAEMLAPFEDRVRLVEPGSTTTADRADVVLFDCFPDVDPTGPGPGRLPSCMATPTLAYSWHARPDLVCWALEHRFGGYVSKALPVTTLVEAVEALRGGETPVRIVPDLFGRGTPTARPRTLAPSGLTPREADVLDLVCSGLSNREIAEQLRLSPNSVKSYIRSAYRRIEVTSRSQAVLWGIEHGFGLRAETD